MKVSPMIKPEFEGSEDIAEKGKEVFSGVEESDESDDQGGSKDAMKPSSPPKVNPQLIGNGGGNETQGEMGGSPGGGAVMDVQENVQEARGKKCEVVLKLLKNKKFRLVVGVGGFALLASSLWFFIRVK